MTGDMPQPPVAVVFAGGDGKRMGGAKPLKALGGMTLLAHALMAAADWSDKVAVSVRIAGQLGALPVPEIVDDGAIEGPLGGLAAALRYARLCARDTVLTIPCDAPFLPPDLALRLQSGLDEGLSAAVASSRGALHPVCALWRTAALEALPDYIRTGQTSLRRFADSLGFAEVEWSCDPFDPFMNINTPTDLSAAAAVLRQGRAP